MSERTRLGVVLRTVMVVEAVIAAPLWAIMHVHPDGEGLTGRGGNGYALVLTVVLRPALMIFGLVAAIALMYPFGAILNEVFPSVFNMSVGSSPDSTSSAGILTKVAGAFIYVGIMMTLVSKIFSLIHVLPDQILRWIGGSQDYFGRGMEQEAVGGAKQAVGSVSSAAQSGYQTHRISGSQSLDSQIEAERVKGDVAKAQRDLPHASASVQAARAQEYTNERHAEEKAFDTARAKDRGESSAGQPSGAATPNASAAVERSASVKTTMEVKNPDATKPQSRDKT